MRAFVLLPAALGLIAAACSSQVAPVPSGPAASSQGSTALTLAMNETTALGEDFTLSFVSVPSDSRCPARVQCVWEGEAKVVVGKSHPLMRFRPDTLTVRGGRGVDSTEVGPFVVKVTRLEPTRVTTDVLPQSAYRATFAVRRR